MSRTCRAAAARVLWLEDDTAEFAVGDDLVALDDAMRVIDTAYESLERAALRAPRGSAVRETALRLAGARRTWLAIAGAQRLGDDTSEEEAFAEVEAASRALRRLLEDVGEPAGAGGNVICLASRRARGQGARRRARG